eukprot:CAMPEP_0198726434 /NCGR_PEP_ID=MMETSP1475-20131203/3482_1 /TAXON_ID= ORGANISM="Unidentified sp., Strain CCMP1999" /NCGR_SAMPLE_ID=MMETSP1475 /ASSEMBLY_ACC=CAM_ASM_001111 /LENGTH=622 /DNA_ID=CAMNT_0044488347 /DNA_START=18 /DNA_END=1886 /DNA_ORIENTATION=+
MSGYVDKISELMDEFTEAARGEEEDVSEQRQMLVENALSELEGSLPRVVRDPRGSRVLEKLINFADPAAIASLLGTLLQGDDGRVVDMMVHPIGSYVFERLVDKIMQGGGEDASKIVEIVDRLTHETLHNLLADKRGSFVLRRIISSLVNLDHNSVLPPLEQGCVNLRNRARLERQHLDSVKEATEKVLELDADLRALFDKPHTMGALSVFIGCSSLIDGADFVSRFARLILGTSYAGFKRFARSKSGSRAVEAIIAFSGEKLISELYTQQLRGSLRDYAFHNCANFTIQRFLLRAGLSGEGLVLNALDEMESDFAELFLRFPGVILALARACSETQSERCCTRFAACLSAASGDKIVHGVLAKHPRALGSMIVQSMLAFPKRQSVQVAREILQLNEEELFSMAKDPSKSRILEAVFQLHSSDKDKKKLVMRLRGQLVTLATLPAGSRVVEAAHAHAPSYEVRRKMVEELSKDVDRLRDSIHGQFVLKHCRVETFLSRRDEWDNMESSMDAKKRVFADLLDDENPPPSGKSALKKTKQDKQSHKRDTKPEQGLQSIMGTLGFAGGELKGDSYAAGSEMKSKAEVADDGSTQVGTVLKAISNATAEFKPLKSKKQKHKRTDNV